MAARYPKVRMNARTERGAGGNLERPTSEPTVLVDPGGRAEARPLGA